MTVIPRGCNNRPKVRASKHMAGSIGMKINRFGYIAHEGIHDFPEIFLGSRNKQMEVIRH